MASSSRHHGGSAVVLPGQQGASHYYSQHEKRAFVNYINEQLAGSDVPYIPLSSDGDDLFTKVEDGVILCKLLNKAVPLSLEEKRICRKDNMSKYQKGENLQLFLDHCGKAGIKLVNIGVDDIMEKKAHLILGVIWQLIKVGLFHKVLQSHPEMIVLLQPDEDVETWDRLSQEDLVLRWVNHHLRKQNSGMSVSNFGHDLKDGRALCVLFSSLEDSGGTPLLSNCKDLLGGESDHERATHVIKAAAKVHLDRFITVDDVVEGRARLLFAFLADVFRSLPSLPPLTKSYLMLNASNAGLQKQLHSLESDVHRANSELEALKVQHSSQQPKEVAVESAVKEAISKAMGARDQSSGSANVLDQLHGLVQELAALRNTLKERDEELANANHLLEQERNKNNDLGKQMQNMGDALGELRSQLSSTEMEREDALSRIDGVRTAFMSLHDSLTVEKAGWLSKQGKRIKMWHKRWFLLKGKMLFYFRSPAEVQSQKPLGFYNVADYGTPSVDSTKPELVKLQPKGKDKSVVEVMGASAHDAMSWVKVIKNTQDKFKEAEEKTKEVEKMTDRMSRLSSPPPPAAKISSPLSPSVSSGSPSSSTPQTPSVSLKAASISTFSPDNNDDDDDDDDDDAGTGQAETPTKTQQEQDPAAIKTTDTVQISNKQEEVTETERTTTDNNRENEHNNDDIEDGEDDDDDDEPPPPPPPPPAAAAAAVAASEANDNVDDDDDSEYVPC